LLPKVTVALLYVSICTPLAEDIWSFWHVYDYEGLIDAIPKLEPLVELHQPYLDSKSKNLRVHNVRIDGIGDLLLIRNTETSYELLVYNEYYLTQKKYFVDPVIKSRREEACNEWLANRAKVIKEDENLGIVVMFIVSILVFTGVV